MGNEDSPETSFVLPGGRQHSSLPSSVTEFTWGSEPAMCRGGSKYAVPLHTQQMQAGRHLLLPLGVKEEALPY